MFRRQCGTLKESQHWQKVMKICIIFALFIAIYPLMAQTSDENLQQIIARLDEQSKVFATIANKVTPAVVNVSVTKKVRETERDPMYDFFGDEFFRRFFGERPPFMPRDREPEQRGLGSGVIVDPKGYILSNNHVVQGADQVTVRLADKREFPAKIIGTDEKTDIAVLKIEGTNLPFVAMGDSDKIAVGQWVLAIGNPFGLNQTVTAGIISAKGRANVGIVEYEDFIQTDAAVNPGNSGGPLVNLHGEIIGINTAIASRTGGNLGIGFAVPINMARSVMEQLIANGKVRRGWLGVRIQEITPELAKGLRLSQSQGALVTEVMKDSPAEKAGLRQDDVIVAFDGTSIYSPNQLRNLVAITAIGKKVRMEIARENRQITLEVTIGDLDRANMQEDVGDDDAGGMQPLSELGIEVREITPELARQYRLRIKSGLLITNIQPNSVAEQYGIREGSVIARVNQIKVQTMSELKASLEKEPSLVVMLLVTPRGSQYIVLPRRK